MRHSFIVRSWLSVYWGSVTEAAAKGKRNSLVYITMNGYGLNVGSGALYKT